MFRYHQTILDALAGHGLAPLPSTPPGRLRDALRELYKYEIRRLRERLLAGAIEKKHYASHVIALRRRYWSLSVPIQLWSSDAQNAGTSSTSAKLGAVFNIAFAGAAMADERDSTTNTDAGPLTRSAETVGNMIGNATKAVVETAQSVASAATRTAGSASEAAGRAVEAAAETAQSMGSAAVDLAGGAAAAAAPAAGAVRRTVRRTVKQARKQIKRVTAAAGAGRKRSAGAAKSAGRKRSSASRGAKAGAKARKATPARKAARPAPRKASSAARRKPAPARKAARKTSAGRAKAKAAPKRRKK